MTTCRSCIKYLKSSYERVFYCIWGLKLWLKPCTGNNQFPRGVLMKEVFWKTSQTSQINTRSSHSEVLCQKMFPKILQNSQKNIFAGVSFLTKLLAGNLKLAEVAAGDSLQNKVFLKILQISPEKTCVGVY